ncbi:hypothetical protein ACLOJK_007185, partial [Asimina triloba]
MARSYNSPHQRVPPVPDNEMGHLNHLIRSASLIMGDEPINSTIGRVHASGWACMHVAGMVEVGQMTIFLNSMSGRGERHTTTESLLQATSEKFQLGERVSRGQRVQILAGHLRAELGPGGPKGYLLARWARQAICLKAVTRNLLT